MTSGTCSMIYKQVYNVRLQLSIHEKINSDNKQHFCAGFAWGAITWGELCTEAEDGRGDRQKWH